MIYEQRCYDVSPEHRQEFINGFGEAVIPALQKLGARVIGFWETSIGCKNEIICLLAYDDIYKRTEIWEKVKKEESYARFPRKYPNSLTVSILEPTKYSPMK